MEAARRRGEIAVDYRVAEHADDSSRSYGVVMNPNKAALNTFCDDDRMIVVAES